MSSNISRMSCHVCLTCHATSNISYQSIVVFIIGIGKYRIQFFLPSLMIHKRKYFSVYFQIEWDMVVVTVFLSILNQMEFQLVQYQEENCHHDRIPVDLKGSRNLSIWVYTDMVLSVVTSVLIILMFHLLLFQHWSF